MERQNKDTTRTPQLSSAHEVVLDDSKNFVVEGTSRDQELPTSFTRDEMNASVPDDIGESVGFEAFVPSERPSLTEDDVEDPRPVPQEFSDDAAFKAWLNNLVTQAKADAGILMEQEVVLTAAAIEVQHTDWWLSLTQRLRHDVRDVAIGEWKKNVVAPITARMRYETWQATLADPHVMRKAHDDVSGYMDIIKTLVSQYGVEVAEDAHIIEILAELVVDGFDDYVQDFQHFLSGQPKWTPARDKRWRTQILSARKKGKGVVIHGAFANATLNVQTVGKVWADAPEFSRGWSLPSEGWVIHQDGVARPGPIGMDGTQNSQPILHVPAMITGMGHGVSDNAVMVRVAWRDSDDAQWHQAWVPRKNVMVPTRVTDTMAELNIDCAPSKSKTVADWFQDQKKAAGPHTIPHLAVMTNCGWMRAEHGWTFLLPDGAIGADTLAIESQVPKYISDLYAPVGDLAAETAIMADLLHIEPQVSWMVGHGAAAPWMQRLAKLGLTDIHGYAVETVSDKTGQGKTFAVRAALMPWQNPEPRLADFSNFSAVEWMAAANDLPHGIQETQEFQSGMNAGRNAPNWISIVQGLSDNGGAVRGRADGGIRMPPSLAGTILFANNQSVIGGAHVNGGGQVRILSTGSLFTRQDDDMRLRVESFEQRMTHAYGHGGRAMLQALAPLSDAEVIALWDTAYADVAAIANPLTQSANEEIRKIAHRQSKIWAAGLLGLRSLLLWGYGWSVPELLPVEAGYFRMMQTLIENFATTYQPEWSRWWNTTASLLRQHAAEFAGLEPVVEVAGDRRKVMPPQGYRGRYLPDRDLLAVEPAWLDDLLHKQGRWDIKTLQKAWMREGLLTPTMKDGKFSRFDRSVRVPRVDGTSYATWMICLKASAIGFGEDGDEEEVDPALPPQEVFDNAGTAGGSAAPRPSQDFASTPENRATAADHVDPVWLAHIQKLLAQTMQKSHGGAS